MAENEVGRVGAPPAKTDPPPRPTIALPPRSSYESLFRGGGGGGGVGASDVSPGPMTLVSSFFAEDPDSDCRSFSQLLAGALASPAAVPARTPVSFPAEEKTDLGGGEGGEGVVLRQNRPLGLVVVQSPFFTVPPGLSPASLLESPAAFFSSGSGHFGISHQQALAQVTAQAVQAHSHGPSLPLATAASMTQPTSSAVNTNNSALESAEDSNCDRRSQNTGITVDKPADDGYNWRKYGQKQVKGSEYPRSYYKCTHPSCPVKKKVEHSFDGHVTEIIYKGQHNHERPAPNKRGKECGALPSGLNELNGSLDFPVSSESVAQGGDPGNLKRSSGTMVVPSTSKKDRESEHLSESSDGEEVGDAELRTNECDGNVPDPKRRKTDTRVTESTSSHQIVSEPRIIVQTTSEVDLLDDGYRWRKYGQKVVKGNPYPRSYYKCTNVGCPVRKHVERASTDPKAVITTYEGKHNHEVPKARNSSHNAASAGAASNVIQRKVQSTVHNFRSNGRQPITLQMKEEHDIV